MLRSRTTQQRRMAGSTMSRFSYHYSRTQGMRGLMNFGLTCCVNALLQSFSATWELLDLLNKWVVVGAEREDHNVPYQLRRALSAMQSDQSQPDPHHGFLQCLDKNRIRCMVYVQHDADEVFLSILNFIQQQMNDKNLVQEIHSLYKLSVEMYLQCSECKFIQSGTSYLLSLPLHIEENHSNSLENCIKSFFELQELRGSDKCYCERCAEKTPSVQGFKLVSLPPVLCLHLKRFRSCRGYTRKLHCEVTFPETFDFVDIVAEETLSRLYVNNGSKYSLCAVVVHSGGTMGGHYTAYVRHKRDQSWYYADDSHVRQVGWTDVQNAYGGSETAYMLLYRRSPLELEQEQHSG